jgi:hypothetical protein
MTSVIRLENAFRPVIEEPGALAMPRKLRRLRG